MEQNGHRKVNINDFSVLVAEKLQGIDNKISTVSVSVEKLPDLKEGLEHINKTLHDIKEDLKVSASRMYKLLERCMLAVFIIILLAMGKEAFLDKILN